MGIGFRVLSFRFRIHFNVWDGSGQFRVYRSGFTGQRSPFSVRVLGSRV